MAGVLEGIPQLRVMGFEYVRLKLTGCGQEAEFFVISIGSMP